VYLAEVHGNTNKPLWEQIMATTTKREQVSFKLETNTKQRLEALAAATRRTRTFVLEEAVNQYLNLNEWQLKSIEAGLEDAKAGRVIDSETLLKKWEKRVEDSLD
jgi:RHH-type rel operon transcriptional repressor/antitoxin RelB